MILTSLISCLVFPCFAIQIVEKPKHDKTTHTAQTQGRDHLADMGFGNATDRLPRHQLTMRRAARVLDSDLLAIHAMGPTSTSSLQALAGAMAREGAQPRAAVTVTSETAEVRAALRRRVLHRVRDEARLQHRAMQIAIMASSNSGTRAVAAMRGQRNSAPEIKSPSSNTTSTTATNSGASNSGGTTTTGSTRSTPDTVTTSTGTESRREGSHLSAYFSRSVWPRITQVFTATVIPEITVLDSFFLVPYF